jgi:predicted DNA-binding protein with PD1-like motif
MKEANSPLETRPMSRRCLLATAALSMAACAVDAKEVASAQSADVPSADLPGAELLSDGDVKTYLLVFRTGQEVMKGLMGFAREQKLVSGHVTGIGALSGAVVGYFDPQKKSYLRIREEGQQELLSLTGNLALYDDAPFYHVHVATGLRDGHTRGGHLFEAIVRPTVELVLTTYARPVRRKFDPAWDLPLLNP